MNASLMNIPLAALVVLGVVAGGLLALAYYRPRAYLALLMAATLLAPITTGLDISDNLPVIFVSRPIVALGLAAWALRRLRGRGVETPANPLLAPLGLLLLGVAFSLPGSVAPKTSIFRFLALLFEWVGVIVLAWDALRHGDDARVALDWLLGIFGGVCLIGLAQAAAGFDPNNLFSTGYQPTGYVYESIRRGGFMRVRSTFPQPIEYAGTLAFLAPVVFMLALNACGWRQALYVALLGLMLANIAFAISLGPLASLTIALACVWMLGEGRRPLAVAGAVLMAGALIVAQTHLFRDAVRELVLDRMNPQTDTRAFKNTAGRVAVVLAAVNAVRQYPVFGAGLNTWFVVNPRATFMGYMNGIGNGNENFYAQLLLETGIVGLTAILLAFGWILARLQRLMRGAQERRQRRVLVGLLAGLVGYLVLNLSANVIGGGAGQSVFVVWVTLALGLRCVTHDVGTGLRWRRRISPSSS
jgi:O-antigen ligase